jgi:phosphonate transport system substrate-binding protein
MSRKLNTVIILGALLVSLLVDVSDPAAEKKQITMTILPCYDIVMTFKKFHPLITYLEQQTGFDIKIAVQTDFSEFELGIRNGDIDFALQDPHTYVSLADLFNRDALLGTLTPEGAASRRGVIITRKGSGIGAVADLREKTVMFGPKQSIAKWIAAKILFEKNGIDIDEDLLSYSNGKCCEDIAFNVYLEAVDAGAVCSHFIDEYSDKQDGLGIDINQIIVIGKTDLVPTRVFTASNAISGEVVTKFIQALLGIDNTNPDHADMLERAEIGGFQSVSDEDYDDVRDLIGIKR